VRGSWCSSVNRTTAIAGWLPAAWFVVMALAPAPAAAFICTRVKDNANRETGPALTWPTRQLTFALQQEGTARISADREFAVLEASFAVWEGKTECLPAARTTDIAFQGAAQHSASRAVGYDFLDEGNNENLLLFYDSGWPHPAQDNLVIALTTTTYVALTGTILDADIEFNSEQIDFAICGSVTDPCDGTGTDTQHDLMNTAVHEIGHYLGLGHTTAADTTMYGAADPMETHKRDLHCDDLNAVVFKYPSGEASGVCNPPVASCGFCAPPNVLTRKPRVSVTDYDDGVGGCSSSAGSGVATPLLLLLMLRPRRRRGGAPDRKPQGTSSVG